MDKNKPKKALINPFLAARKSSEIIAAIGERDVQAVRPQWSTQQATEFLHRNSRTIAVFMLESGLSAMRQLMEDTHDN